MDQGQNFEHFFQTRISPFLDGITKNEIALKNWRRFTIASGAGAFLFLFLHFMHWLPSGLILAGIMLIICVAGVYFSGKYSDDYLDDFKEKIIGQIIDCIHPGSVYKPMGFISHKEYKASGLYRKRYTHFDGDDFWQSEYDGIAFHCSEIFSKAEYTTGTVIIFRGLFFAANLKRQVRGGIYIWAKGSTQLPASIADEHHRLFPLPEVQKHLTAHTAFNSFYSVYTTNSYEAADLLTPQMLDHMVEIRQKLKKKIVYSFVDGHCYVAVPFEQNLLEPSGRGVDDKDAIRDYFYTILLVFNIIKKLELNRLT